MTKRARTLHSICGTWVVAALVSCVTREEYKFVEEADGGVRLERTEYVKSLGIDSRKVDEEQARLYPARDRDEEMSWSLDVTSDHDARETMRRAELREMEISSGR